MRREEDSFEGYRHQRLQELIAEELRSLLRDDVRDPALQSVRIAALVLSPDYRHARIHFGVIEAIDAEATRLRVERALIRAAPFLRTRLAEAVEMKRVPELRFVFDGAFATEARFEGAVDDRDEGGER